MTAIIAFGETEDTFWVSWRIYFDALMNDVVATSQDGPEIAARLEGNLAVGDLAFEEIDKDLRRQAFLGLKRVVSAIVNDETMPGMTWKEQLDATLHEEFPRSMRRLLELMVRYESKALSAS